MSRRDIYAAPWAEPLVARADKPTELVEYGPTARAYERQVARFRDWSWRPRSRRQPLAARDLLRAYMRGPGGHLRDDVPEREREVYLAVHEQGHSTRWAARALGLSRSAVATYLRRLRARAKRAAEPARPNPTHAVRTLARYARNRGRAWFDLVVEAAA